MVDKGKLITWIVVGDTICAIIVTSIGFLTHYGDRGGWRILTSLVPVLVGWFLIAPWIGNYRMENIRLPAQAWRAGLAAIMLAPLAAWLRGAWLNSAIQPVFIAVLGLTNAFGFILWRVLLAFFFKWTERNG